MQNEEASTEQAQVVAEVAPVETAPPPPPEPKPEPSASRIELSPEGVRGVDPATRDALLFGEQPAAEEGTDAAKATEDAAAAEAAKAEAEAAKKAEDEEEGDKLTKNFRLHTEDPKQSAFLKAYKSALAVNPNVNPADIARAVGYEAPPAEAKAAAEIPGLGEAPAQADPLAAMQAEANALAEKMAEHDDELVGPELRKLQSEHAAKLAEIAAIRAVDKYRAEVGDTQRRSARETSKAAVLADYPTAGDDATMLGAEIGKQWLEVRDPAHPDHARFQKNDGPQFLTERAVEAVKARLVATGRFTPEEALAAIKGKPYAEAKGPAGTPPTKPVSTAVPKFLGVAAPGNRPAAEPATVDVKTLVELAKRDPKLRDAALFGDSGTVFA